MIRRSGYGVGEWRSLVAHLLWEQRAALQKALRPKHLLDWLLRVRGYSVE